MSKETKSIMKIKEVLLKNGLLTKDMERSLYNLNPASQSQFTYPKLDETYIKSLYPINNKILEINTGQGTINNIINSPSLEALDILSRLDKKSDVVSFDITSENLLFNGTETTVSELYSENKWFTYIENRIVAIKKIMSKRSVLFVSVDDRYVAETKLILNKILGGSNFVSTMFWDKPDGSTQIKFLNRTKEYVLVYKSKDLPNFRRKQDDKTNTQTIKTNKLDRMKKYTGSNDYPIPVPDTNGEFAYAGGSKEGYDARQKGIHNNIDWRWVLSKENYKDRLDNGYISFKKDKQGYWKVYNKYTSSKDRPFKDSVFADTYRKGGEEVSLMFNKVSTKKIKPTSYFKYLINLHPDNDIHILDVNGENASLGQAVLEMNHEDGFNRTFTLIADENTDGYLDYFSYERLKKQMLGYTTAVNKDTVESKSANLQVFDTVLKTEINKKEIFNSSLELLHNIIVSESNNQDFKKYTDYKDNSVYILNKSIVKNLVLKNTLSETIVLNKMNTIYIPLDISDPELSRELISLGFPSPKIKEVIIRN